MTKQLRSVYRNGKVIFSSNISMLLNARDMFTSGSKVLLCEACEQSVVMQQLLEVTQHLTGGKHIATIIGLKNWPGRQCNW